MAVTKQNDAGNDYTGTSKAKKKAPSTAAVSDRYSKRSSIASRSIANKAFDTEVAVATKADPDKELEDLETRSVR